MIGPSAAFLAGMIAWVSSVTGLPVPPTPKIIFDTVWTDDADAYALPGEIHLKRNWDQNNPVHQAYLAHELVHVSQWAAHVKYHCQNEAERLAYAVQAIYLSKFAVDFWEDHPPRWLASKEECR